MILKNFKLILLDEIKEGTVIVKDGIIKDIVFDSWNEINIDNSEEVVDGKGKYLSPGFIDVHIHGAGGSDTMDATFESLNTISKTIVSYGTTSFLPTTMTQSKEKVKKAIEAVKDAKGNVDGAKIIGIHMEGPFVNGSKETIGAQNPKFVLPPSVKEFNDMVCENEDLITTVTLAPEIDGASDLIKYLRGKNINASMGHTKANYEEAMEAIKCGVNHATHLYNAMPPLHHRNPSVIGAIFDTDITTETISDGIHVSYPMLRLAYNVKGIKKVILVTDAMMACGMHDGLYELGGQEVIKKGMEARLNNGALAGSVLTLDKAIKNVYSNSSIPLHEVIRMASYNPAVLSKVDNITGQIKVGLNADLVILDEDLNVTSVFVDGVKKK